MPAAVKVNEMKCESHCFILLHLGLFSKVITCWSSVCFVFLRQRMEARNESMLCSYLEFQRKQLEDDWRRSEYAGISYKGTRQDSLATAEN